MYLSKLRIFGFKSFANKIEVNFPGDGITAVVGPNGCGKSNIIDAIRWVLGEQRARALRSTRMEDVIFSGTTDKPPMSMAEVALVINNDKGVLPSEYSQIMITRRAYRNGDSEYLLNNQPCRLKDIQNLFFDTGMGAASYSLIEAKMIDSILSDKPEERRNMFEEAAGISKYKQQRKEALRQLEKTAADLARVEDNLRHVRQNVAMFERQAKKAEKWKELHDAYVSLELSYQYDSYLRAQKKFEQHRNELDDLSGQLNGSQSKISTLEAQLEERKLMIVNEENDLHRLNQSVQNIQNEIIVEESQGQRALDRIKHWEVSLANSEKEVKLTAERIAGIELQKTNAREEIRQLEEERLRLNALATHQGEVLQGHRFSSEESRRQTDELNEDRVRHLENLSGLRNRMQVIRSELSHLQNSRDEVLERQDSVLQRESEFLSEKEKLDQLGADYSEQVHELESQRNQLRDRLENLRVQLSTVTELSRDSETHVVALETRYQLLEKLQQGLEGVQKGTRHLLQNHSDRVRGILADQIKVEDDDISTVERCLGASLQILWTDDQSSNYNLLNNLAHEKQGEASLFTSRHTGEIQQTQFVNTVKSARPELEGLSGFRYWVLDKVNAPQALSPLLTHLLGHYARVDSFENAEKIFHLEQYTDLWLILDNGQFHHSSGLVSGGSTSDSSEGLLRRKADFEQTSQKLEHMRIQLKESLHKRDELSLQVKSLESSLRECDESLQKILRTQQEAKGKEAVIQSGLEALSKDREQLSSRLKQSDEKIAELARAAEEKSEELQIAEEQRQVLENRFQSSLGQVQSAEQEKKEFEEQLRNLERDSNAVDAQLKNLRNKLEYLQRSEEEQMALKDKLQGQQQEWSDFIARTKLESEGLVQKIAEFHNKLEAQEKERDRAKEIYDAKVVYLDEIRLQIKKHTEDQQAFTRQCHDRELKVQQTQAVMQSIRERMFEIHEIDLDDEEKLNFVRRDYDEATVEEEIRAQKEQLKRLGSVSTGALEDYESEKKKLDDVQGQFDDLEKARVGLERAIRKLDKVAREQFHETFQIVQKNFQEVFSSLFEGGEAHVSLDESEDPLDARIEINARPTGKKMRGVTLLSGGERALTAISLLFALYLVKPSPYCIMDEVDGPLDDANIGRFVNLLRRFSNQTQFIVVTHNKRTMAASDMLYGVTQEVKGISRLVSVQLNEATKIAA